MSIFLNSDSKILVQGMTGSEGTKHTKRMLASGAKVVAGVTPGKGGSSHLDRPVFNTVADAVKATGADVHSGTAAIKLITKWSFSALKIRQSRKAAKHANRKSKMEPQ